MTELSPVVAAKVITEPPAHCLSVTRAYEGAGFGIVLSCAGCLDTFPGESAHEWHDVAGSVIFDPSDPGNTEKTVAQLLDFLASHDAFGLSGKCGKHE